MAIKFTPKSDRAASRIPKDQSRDKRKPHQNRPEAQEENQTVHRATFDRKAYQREYMRAYMRKRRAKAQSEGGNQT